MATPGCAEAAMAMGPAGGFSNGRILAFGAALVVTGAWLLGVCRPPTAAAQVVRGHIVESGSGRPVVLGWVGLLDTTLLVLDETYSDHAGEFLLRAPGPGAYLVAVEALGYAPLIDGIIDLGEDGFLPVDVYVKPQPIELAGITATGRRQRAVEKLERAGFFARAAQGFGHFVTPEEIEERQPPDVPSLLRSVPGPVWDKGGIFGNTLLMRSRGPTPGRIVDSEDPSETVAPAGYCYPSIYVDGAVVWHPKLPPPPPAIEELVAIEDVAAVEVYTGPASTPLQWGGSQAACGVILFWTG
jgi:hypothetical protein